MNIFIIVMALGFIGAFIAGMAGIGGAIIMIPLLYFIPQLLGVEQLSMQTIAAVTIVQVFVATGSAVLIHKSNNFVNNQLVLWMGTSIIIGSFIGGFGSKYVPEEFLSIIFATLALIASVMMFIPKKNTQESGELIFNKPLAAASAAIVGALAGLVGAGGAFMLVPIMLYILRIPLRITVGSSLGIIFFSAASGFIGKILSGQMIWSLALAITIGAFPGARLGGKLSKFIPEKTLKIILAVLICGSAIKMWIDILF
ncbi:MAG: hypothetical protein JM58_05070 [Peptococcaceae bacterium BICA1-8]|nr:MAG: hypothetical protein JM58_05070 [Peptococcaceae bacterium BICA1-8]